MTENFNIQHNAKRERAKYEIIKEYLLDEFMTGNYIPGQPLLSENTLAKTFGVARSTVRQAIGRLENDGMVQRIQGKGSFFTRNIKTATSQQLEVFSLVVPDITRGLYPTLAKGFDYQAGLAHYQLMLCNTAFDIRKQGNIILQMIDKNVSGVMLVPALYPPTPPFHIRQLQDHGIPVVFCHRPVEDSTAPLITWDKEEVARLAGQTFLEHGHRRIAYFARYSYLQTQAYEKGLRKTLEAHGVDLPENRVYYGTNLDNTTFERNKKSQALRAMLNSSEPVTAIFCHDDDEAEMIYYLVAEMGLRVPYDLSLIGFGDCHERTGIFRSRLTSVAVNEFDLGACAARILQEMRTGQRPLDSNKIICTPLTLVEGKTLGMARERGQAFTLARSLSHAQSG